ncbi:MAG: hypothetical protein JWR05_75 [Mucilaginibacter sp.]|nr:hypothetical protein [Mucilaginibacter sp.]
MRYKYPFFLLIEIFIIGCNKFSPAGFWKGFDSEHIIEKVSDQGPWGGHRAIYWQNTIVKYKESDILKFAAGNDWTFITSKPTGVQETPKDWIKYPGTLYIFNSGWVRFENEEGKTAFGYVLINADHTKMSVYHSWGE